MTIYIDIPKIRTVRGRQRLTAHLMGDSLNELLEFCSKHGIREWRVDKVGRHPHADLWGRDLERILEILAPVSTKEMLKKVRNDS